MVAMVVQVLQVQLAVVVLQEYREHQIQEAVAVQMQQVALELL